MAGGYGNRKGHASEFIRFSGCGRDVHDTDVAVFRNVFVFGWIADKCDKREMTSVHHKTPRLQHGFHPQIEKMVHADEIIQEFQHVLLIEKEFFHGFAEKDVFADRLVVFHHFPEFCRRAAVFQTFFQQNRIRFVEKRRILFPHPGSERGEEPFQLLPFLLREEIGGLKGINGRQQTGKSGKFASPERIDLFPGTKFQNPFPVRLAEEGFFQKGVHRGRIQRIKGVGLGSAASAIRGAELQGLAVQEEIINFFTQFLKRRVNAVRGVSEGTDDGGVQLGFRKPGKIGGGAFFKIFKLFKADPVGPGNVLDFSEEVHDFSGECGEIRIGNGGGGNDSVAVLHGVRYDFLAVADLFGGDSVCSGKVQIEKNDAHGLQNFTSFREGIVDGGKFEFRGTGVDAGTVFQKREHPADGVFDFIGPDFPVPVGIHECEKFPVADHGIDPDACHGPMGGIQFRDPGDVFRIFYDQLEGAAESPEFHALSGRRGCGRRRGRTGTADGGFHRFFSLSVSGLPSSEEKAVPGVSGISCVSFGLSCCAAAGRTREGDGGDPGEFFSSVCPGSLPEYCRMLRKVRMTIP